MRDEGDRKIVPWLALALLAATVVVLWPFAPWIWREQREEVPT